MQIPLSKEILPVDGSALYFGCIYRSEEADGIFESLLKDISWEHDRALIFGKEFITKRKVAWYADEAFSYTYSNSTKIALPFTELLQKIRTRVEKITGERYNSCLLNLYHSGNEGMAWHSDGEKELLKNGSIASLSFGAARKFSFKHKTTGEKVELWLENGSLLEMRGSTQSHWQHRLPPTKKILSPRINLTFRQMST